MALLPWISVGALVLAVAGGVVGARKWKTPARQERPALAASIADAPVAALPPAPAGVASANMVETPSSSTAPPPQSRVRARTPTDDIRGQIALIDAARAAVSASSGDHALDLLRQYQDKYPARRIPSEGSRAQGRGAGKARANLGSAGPSTAIRGGLRREPSKRPCVPRIAIRLLNPAAASDCVLVEKYPGVTASERQGRGLRRSSKDLRDERRSGQTCTSRVSRLRPPRVAATARISNRYER